MWNELLEPSRPLLEAFHWNKQDPDDLRFWEIVRTWKREEELESLLAKDAVALVGVPCDAGVKLSRGRGGARSGPAGIRRQLFRLTPGGRTELQRKITLVDAGNVRIAGQDDLTVQILDSHEKLATVVEKVIRAGAIPIVLGGGHDYAFSTFLGLLKSLTLSGKQPAGLVNVDPHLDVRDPAKVGINSGTAFFRLLEAKENLLTGARFVEFGAQEARCAPFHYSYLRSKGARVCFFDDLLLENWNAASHFEEALQRAGEGKAPVTVSFDMDGYARSATSASTPLGFSASDYCRFAYLAGKFDQTSAIEIAEAAPDLDDENQSTAQVAALMIFYFLRGVVKRRGESHP